MKILTKFLLSLWQLPQTLVGLVYRVFISKRMKNTKTLKFEYIPNVVIYYNYVGVYMSLGTTLFLGSYSDELDLRHEFGHCKQSLILGPLYLFVVGIPSVLHAWLHNCKDGYYYHFYTERWADNLMGIIRTRR